MSTALDVNDHAALRRLEAQNGELAGQRAGDLSNQQLTTILLVLGIVVALIFIL